MRRAVLASIAAVAWWLLSCREIPAPDEGVFSISPLILPSPGLVVDDTMRDSLGFVAPLRVVAFDIDGNPIADAQATFVAVDTGAHLAGALLIGDDTVATSVVGAVAGLQTDTVRVPVTLAPQQLIAVAALRQQLTATVIDTAATSPDLTTRVENVSGATPRGIQAIIVRYEVVQAPPPTSATAGPTVVLLPAGSGARDTTDGSGNAGRQVRFRLLAISAPTDSAVINASASYRGQTLGTVQFTVVFTKQ